MSKKTNTTSSPYLHLKKKKIEELRAELAKLEAETAKEQAALRAEVRSERIPEHQVVQVEIFTYGEAEDDLGTFRLGSETIRQSDVNPKTELYDILQAIANSDKNPNERFYELFNVVFEGRLGVLLVANTPSRKPTPTTRDEG